MVKGGTLEPIEGKSDTGKVYKEVRNSLKKCQKSLHSLKLHAIDHNLIACKFISGIETYWYTNK